MQGLNYSFLVRCVCVGWGGSADIMPISKKELRFRKLMYVVQGSTVDNAAGHLGI